MWCTNRPESEGFYWIKTHDTVYHECLYFNYEYDMLEEGGFTPRRMEALANDSYDDGARRLNVVCLEKETGKDVIVELNAAENFETRVIWTSPNPIMAFEYATRDW